MIYEKPKFMENKKAYDYDEEGEIYLTEVGLKDPDIVKEFIEYIKAIREEKLT